MTNTDELIALGLIDAPASGPTMATTAARSPSTVPPNPDFIPPPWYPVLRHALTSGREKGATMFGPRGSGKSTAIRELARSVGAEWITLQCAANMQLDSLLGTWTSEQGSLRFIDGPLALAVRRGAWLIAEEANAIHPGVWSSVNTLTDRTGEGLRLPTGEVIPPHSEFRLILAFNDGYAGMREVNPALKDRLLPIHCGYLDSDSETRVLMAMTGAEESDCRRVLDVGTMIREARLRFDLSPRALARWLDLVLIAGLSWQEGFERAILDLVGAPDMAGPQRAALEEIAKNTVAQW